jgi:hypothetical protein
MAAGDAFSRDYAHARVRFREAAERSGAVLTHAAHPRQGPAGEALATDLAWVGPLGASRVLVIVSGTHGVEGFCGSAIQCAWLASRDACALPPDTAVMLVHALNPFGFAWLRRVNEDNVDLNRNFVDWTAPLPGNDGYDLLHESLLCAADRDARPSADATLREFVVRHGAAAFQAALTRGQYRHPDGLFYGGRQASWSARLFEALARERLTSATDVALVDLHSGLGPFGYGQPMSFDAPGSDALARARSWYGPSLGVARGASEVTSDLDGTLYDGLRRWLPAQRVTSIALEFGTHAVADGIAALRTEAAAWRAAPGSVEPDAQAARRALRAFFDVERDDWRELVSMRGAQILRQALAGLAEGARSAG